jgi:16S rRNA G527 N7-methylase RsmG
MIDISEKFKQYSVKLTTSQLEKFGKFLGIFLEKNSQVNLSAIRDEE